MTSLRRVVLYLCLAGMGGCSLIYNPSDLGSDASVAGDAGVDGSGDAVPSDGAADSPIGPDLCRPLPAPDSTGPGPGEAAEAIFRLPREDFGFVPTGRTNTLVEVTFENPARFDSSGAILNIPSDERLDYEVFATYFADRPLRGFLPEERTGVMLTFAEGGQSVCFEGEVEMGVRVDARLASRQGGVLADEHVTELDIDNAGNLVFTSRAWAESETCPDCLDMFIVPNEPLLEATLVTGGVDVDVFIPRIQPVGGGLSFYGDEGRTGRHVGVAPGVVPAVLAPINCTVDDCAPPTADLLEGPLAEGYFFANGDSLRTAAAPEESIIDLTGCSIERLWMNSPTEYSFAANCDGGLSEGTYVARGGGPPARAHMSIAPLALGAEHFVVQRGIGANRTVERIAYTSGFNGLGVEVATGPVTLVGASRDGGLVVVSREFPARTAKRYEFYECDGGCVRLADDTVLPEVRASSVGVISPNGDWFAFTHSEAPGGIRQALRLRIR